MHNRSLLTLIDYRDRANICILTNNYKCRICDKIDTFIPLLVHVYKNHTKEQFYLERQGLPSEEVTIDNRIYMCKDKDDTPASCNTYGIGDPILNKYINSSAPCPKNWLEPGNSIYN